MKRIVRYIMITALVAVLSSPVMEAREGRQGRGGNNGRTEQTDRNSGHNAPGRRPGGNNHGNRPGGSNHGNRPGGYEPGHNRPGNKPGLGFGPGHKPGHKPGYKPGHTPGYHPGHGHHVGARPLPPPRHDYWPRYHRPTPPPRYVYRAGGPSFGSILGMVLGTAFNVSLNYLNTNGYVVSGYGNNTIYLNNVSQMNFNWPNAVLYYNGGLLSSSQYIYSTPWQDTTRYNMLFNSLSRQYGAPASLNNTGNGLTASWFGYDGRFVTIQYSPGYTANGTGCYYTTLSFGN